MASDHEIAEAYVEMLEGDSLVCRELYQEFRKAGPHERGAYRYMACRIALRGSTPEEVDAFRILLHMPRDAAPRLVEQARNLRHNAMHRLGGEDDGE